MRVLSSILLLWGVAFLVTVAAADPATNDDNWALETLLQKPSLIGVAPRHFEWSRDARVLAFTWNDEGGKFQDVWVLESGSSRPRRLTRHGGAGDRGPGVTELEWLGANRLAYVLGGKLYVTDLKGRSRIVEDSVPAIRQVSLSPDGKLLAFVSGGPLTGYLHDFESDGSLWVRPADADSRVASRKLLATPAERSFVQSFEWSAGSDRLALVLADHSEVQLRELHYYDDKGELKVHRFSRAFPGELTTRRSLGTVDVTNGSVRWLELANDLYPIWDYGLSADGSRLYANTSDYVIKEHVIYMFDVASGKRETFYRFEDPQNVVPGWQAAWAPGDEGLIIQTDRDGYYHLYHKLSASAEPRALTSGEWEVESFEVDAQRGLIYFVANESHLSERQLYRVSLKGGDMERLTTTAGTWEPRFSPDYTRVALKFSNDVTPPDLYALDLQDGKEIRRVTNSPRPEFHDYEWARVTYPEFESHVDGTKIYGRLSVPPDFDPARKYPLIVGSVYANTVHNRWGRGRESDVWALDQHLVSKGYLVLKVNVRGSWGQGKAFSRGLIRDYGGIDTDDIESGVRHLIEEGFVDRERVGIWGNSYGGLMTLMSLFKKPGVYAAGIAGAPATNVWHAYPSQMWVMGEPKGDDYPERYRRQSALYQSAGLQDPLMIIHGTADPVVLYSDTIALISKMIDQRKDFELVTLPEASHGWADDNPKQTLFIFHKMVDFFDRQLMKP